MDVLMDALIGLVQELLDGSFDNGWVRWTHRSFGRTHCEECLKPDGCWFAPLKNPHYPHHPYCHCLPEPIEHSQVAAEARATATYSKFDPYLFNTKGEYFHTKEKMFYSWGYTVEDSSWLQREIQRQGLTKYIAGDYELGKLNEHGQRIRIRVEIPKKNGGGTVSFITGWPVFPNGHIKLATPYGDN